ncbi:MAG TPA: class I SAM-dependent methyltransferase [Anaerolineales bacterium]
MQGAFPSVTVGDVRDYWNRNIHDLEIVTHPIGTSEFFGELEAYRFNKLRYLPRLVDFAGFQSKRVLEVGCGVGIDLARFARGGADVTGVDLAERSIELAKRNFESQGLDAKLLVMDGEHLEFPEHEYDLVYAHGVLQYTPDPGRMLDEIHRVLKPAGQAILMMYNQRGWLPLLSRLTGVNLEHDDAPAFHLVRRDQFEQLLAGFRRVTIVAERFPVPTRLHGGWKAFLYNRLFVGAFNALPRRWIEPSGWHLMAFAWK